MLQDFIL